MNVTFKINAKRMSLSRTIDKLYIFYIINVVLSGKGLLLLFCDYVNEIICIIIISNFIKLHIQFHVENKKNGFNNKKIKIVFIFTARNILT